MDPLPSTIRPLFRDRALSDTFAARPRLASEPLSSSPRRHDDNRSVGSMNKALESMLRTTTETGEIGIFSIKPSRVPQSQNTPRRPPAPHDNGLQRPKPTFQPYGVPVVDDRRRLPSYARDVASEVNSMNDSASQKSAARNFENADYRSYSLTQTSYPSYTLSNYRSYSSLRSQQDGNPHASTGVNGPLQRPRSPFAYPTRLKRPGFRPSSPALTDGGIIDYSRRAEIELHPYVSSACLWIGQTRNTSGFFSGDLLTYNHPGIRTQHILSILTLCTEEKVPSWHSTRRQSINAFPLESTFTR